MTAHRVDHKGPLERDVRLGQRAKLVLLMLLILGLLTTLCTLYLYSSVHYLDNLWRSDQTIGSAHAMAILTQAHQMTYRTLVGGLLLLLVAAGWLIAVMVADGRVGRPMGTLEQAALAVARGDLSARVPVSGDDDVAAAGRSFNLMAERIQEGERSLRVRAQQQKAVAELQRRALQGSSVGQLQRQAVAIVRQLLDVSYASILEISPGDSVFRFKAGDGWTQNCPEWATLPATPEFLATATFNRSTPIVIENVQAESHLTFGPMLQAHGVVSAVSVAITTDSHAYGIIGAFTTTCRAFTQDDVDFLRDVADVIATTVRRHEQDRAQALLQSVTRSLVGAGSLVTIAPPVLATIAKSFGWEFGALWRTDSQSGSLDGVVSWHSPDCKLADLGALVRTAEFAPGNGLPGRAAATGQVIWAELGSGDETFPGQQICEREGLRTALAVPVGVGGPVLGVLLFIGRDIRKPDRWLLRTMAEIGVDLGRFIKGKAELIDNEKLRSRIEASPLPIITLDREWHVTMWSQAAEEMLGWRAEEVLGKKAPGDPDQLLALRDRIFMGESVFTPTLKTTCRDGSAVEISLSLAPVYDRAGNVTEILAVVNDVTDRNRFLQNAAHELRNPISGVKGLLSLMQRRIATGKKPDELAKTAAVAEREVDRLSAYLEQTVQALLMQKTHLVSRREHVNLADVIDASLEPFRAITCEHRLHFANTAAEEGCVMGDFVELEAVVRNLLSNAIKYSPDGGDIQVSLGIEGDSAIIIVRDAGVGIPPDEISRIFELSFRSPNLAHRDPGGLGLGLPLCKELVERHYGQIWAESEEGVGTAMHVKLPRCM